ncbi:MAG TPA: M14-type cytosolic carboxypeptidase [Phenylobacterium sp.]|uniref:M14 family metallopeptidase n=1 Tax=Phenylobacterium sp. TaxID=1871053 RepID=UPI002B488A68|nr:M14-type cytosolic carboxypeptidase [Phenylobacterium sp.]HKR88195.1 M14-type cytosolic carboxypeptidase [Phenylobacterium sp.]
MSLAIDADFHGGNIIVQSLGEAGADLAIRQDSNGPWLQWFYFRVSGAGGRALTLRIVNAGGSTYPEGWAGYRACVSEDGETWTRAETRYADGVLEIRHRPAAEALHVAYFPPYDDRRHQALLARATAAGARGDVLGRSVNGRAIDRLTIGSGPRQVWWLGRQHSGETMASWWMEGALERLLDPADAAGRALTAAATVHVVPLVNVDGAARGNLRGNAAGLDLNRQWHGPDPAKAPEVAAVLAAMDATGVDLSLDVHGDETLPHVFVDGADVDPQATTAQIGGVERFKTALLAASPAFQTKVGYPPTYAGAEAPGMCTRAVARRYGAVGLTLEMPFKDSLEAPDAVAGWSIGASRQLGRDALPAVLAGLGVG